MGMLEENIKEFTPARIAIYDDMLSAPRIVDIQPTDIAEYIEAIASKTYEFSQQKGGSIPYTVIREVCENFIHANFKDPCISILNKGNTIKFTDQGPGIIDKQKAQQPSFTSATKDMRKYIRGVGSGLPIVKEYLNIQNGRLIIEDNIVEGTVVTIQIDDSSTEKTPIVYREDFTRNKSDAFDVSDKEYSILSLAKDMGLIGPTEIRDSLGISVSTGHRALEKLEKKGLLEVPYGSTKRILTDAGLDCLNNR